MGSRFEGKRRGARGRPYVLKHFCKDYGRTNVPALKRFTCATPREPSSCACGPGRRAPAPSWRDPWRGRDCRPRDGAPHDDAARLACADGRPHSHDDRFHCACGPWFNISGFHGQSIPPWQPSLLHGACPARYHRHHDRDVPADPPPPRTARPTPCNRHAGRRRHGGRRRRSGPNAPPGPRPGGRGRRPRRPRPAPPATPPPPSPSSATPAARARAKSKSKKDAKKGEVVKKPAPKAPPPPKAPVPNAMVAQLKPLAGSWTCTGHTFGPGPDHLTKGTLTFAWQIGGFWLEAR